MITPSFGLTATERVLPRLALDFTTASLDSRVTFTRALNTATRINSSGLIEIVNADLPRFDFELNTGGACKGLLIEESRINIARSSANLSDTTYWTRHGTASATADQGIAPDGTNTATLITGATDVVYNGNNIRQIVVASANTAYSNSVYVKTVTATTCSIAVRDGASGAQSTATLALTSSWQRINVTRTMGATTVALSVQIGGADGDLLVWGAQIEAGAFPTSYIPTEATAVTRNADVATMTGTNFSDWYNAVEGAFVAQGSSFVPNTVSAFNKFLTVSDNSPSNFFDLGRSGSNSRVFGVTAGVAFASISNGTWNQNVTGKPSIAYKQDDIAAIFNSGAAGVDTSQNIPVVDRLYIGSSSGGAGNYWNGYIQKINYYPQRLLNVELAAFTK